MDSAMQRLILEGTAFPNERLEPKALVISFTKLQNSVTKRSKEQQVKA